MIPAFLYHLCSRFFASKEISIRHQLPREEHDHMVVTRKEGIHLIHIRSQDLWRWQTNIAVFFIELKAVHFHMSLVVLTLPHFMPVLPRMLDRELLHILKRYTSSNDIDFVKKMELSLTQILGCKHQASWLRKVTPGTLVIRTQY
jgi:hypothetical protein